ncbi:hypothetical protein [Natrarchaeobaculum aegyptiacum]|nr:hypothetical protein [Natrarchaeobaculum aegyptiacum]
MEDSPSRDPITGVSLEDDDVPIYLPGTPTLSFVRYIERAISMLRR